MDAYFEQVINLLRESTDEIMRGVDWKQVNSHVGFGDETQDDTPKTSAPMRMRKSETLSMTTWSLLRC